MAGTRRLRGLAPVADARSRVLILGSMPGTESLRLRQYYAHPANQFWRLVAGVLRTGVPGDYGGRLRMLGDAHIAVWDAVETCFRAGAMDADIRGAEPNDIGGFLGGHPGIRAVFFNGRTAEAMFWRHHPSAISRARAFLLPSSSPAYARLGFPGKAARWASIRDHL